MKKKAVKYLYITVVLFFLVLFVAKFGKQAILKAYIEAGIGNCVKIPILCIVPEEEAIISETDKDYISGLLPYSFPARQLPYVLPKMKVSVPKGFTVIRGAVTKVYYKKRKYNSETPTVYLLYQKPEFFINLFPQLKKLGIKNNYDFVSRTMNARFTSIDGITDTFFVIMKSIFTPDIGDQRNVKIARFHAADKKGFITYNLGITENYFDCDVIGDNDAFYKLYIKDMDQKLDLGKVVAIVSTLKVSGAPAPVSGESK
jgi:hypothetical protein